MILSLVTIIKLGFASFDEFTTCERITTLLSIFAETFILTLTFFSEESTTKFVEIATQTNDCCEIYEPDKRSQFCLTTENVKLVRDQSLEKPSESSKNVTEVDEEKEENDKSI